MCHLGERGVYSFREELAWLLLLYALFNNPHMLIQLARVQKGQFPYRLGDVVTNVLCIQALYQIFFCDIYNFEVFMNVGVLVVSIIIYIISPMYYIDTTSVDYTQNGQ